MKTTIALFLTVIIGLVGCNPKKSTSDQPVKDSLTVTKPAKKGPAIIQEQPQPDSLKGSIQAEAIGKLGDAELKVSYYSPAVRKNYLGRLGSVRQSLGNWRSFCHQY